MAVFEAVGNQFGYMGLGNVMHMNVFYACLNKEASHEPEHLRGRSLYLQGDLAEILSAIQQKRPNANAKSEGVNNHG